MPENDPRSVEDRTTEEPEDFTTLPCEPVGELDDPVPLTTDSSVPRFPMSKPDGGPYGGPFTYLDSEPVDPPPARGDTR